MSEQCPRFQIAFLGSGGTGKTSILKRYLNGIFSTEYVETVEDTFSQPYTINGKLQNIDYIDTAGSISFPAMQQIYMSQANGFVLIYSIHDKDSFEEMKSLWDKIKSMRKNILNIPVVIVGNNLDMENVRKIETFEAMNWAYGENLGGCFLEVSALENKNIRDIFDMLLEQFGNTRAQQKGPFRIRSTSLSRRHSDAETAKALARAKKLSFFKTKSTVTTERVIPSNKDFRDSVFDDYKPSNIKRVYEKVWLPRTPSTDSDNIPTAENDISCLKSNNYAKKNNSKTGKFLLSNLSSVYYLVRKYCSKSIKQSSIRKNH